MKIFTSGTGCCLALALLVAIGTSGGDVLADAAESKQRVVCNTSDLRCAGSGKTCDIKFRNRTGVSENLGCGRKGKKGVASAATLKVTVRDQNGKAMGNDITIDAGKSNSINLDKKARDDFSFVRVRAVGLDVPGVELSCSAVRAILQGNGTCKIYIDDNMNTNGWIVANCDQGNVCVDSQADATSVKAKAPNVGK